MKLLALLLVLACSAFADTAATFPSGVPITFKLTIGSGSAPTAYQWYRGLTPIPGAVSSTYRIPAVTVADSGVYSCIVANAAGNVSSDKGTLTVTPPPVVKPGNVTVGISEE